MKRREAEENLASLRRRPHWSFSRINALVNFCSLAWAFHYVYRAEPVSTPVALVFGGAFHSALAFHMARIFDGIPAPVTETAELFADLLNQSLTRSDPPVRLDAGQTAGALIREGQQMLAVYTASVDPAEKIIGISVPFSVPLFDAAGEPLGKPLIGEFDLAVQTGGVYTIVDWKTSARRWPKNKARTDLQPTCYLYAHYRGTGDLNARFRFDVVTKGNTPACEQHGVWRSRDDFERLGELVRVLEKIVANECFHPSDASWECKGCPYGLACQSWHRDRARTRVHFELAA